MPKAKDRRQTENADAPQPAGATAARQDLPETEAPAPQPARLKRKVYRSELAGLQVDLVKLQAWITGSDRPAVIILEGLGPAGKVTTAEAITAGLHRNLAEVVRLDPPGKRERQQWYFQRFVERLPKAGKLVVFDGSWYHYPAVERSLGFCEAEGFDNFLDQCASFEKTLVDAGVALVKYWFSADDDEQDRRFRSHIADLAKRKQLYLAGQKPGCEPQPVADVAATIFARTDRPGARWFVVDAGDKRRGRLNFIHHLLSLVSAESGSAPEPGSAGAHVPQVY